MSRLSSECLLWQRFKHLYLINLIQIYLSRSNFCLWATSFLIVSGEEQAHAEVLHPTFLGWLSWDTMNYPPEELRQINPTWFICFKKFPLILVTVRSAQYFIRMMPTKGVRDLSKIMEPCLCSFCLSDLRNSIHKKRSTNDHLCEVCTKELCLNHPAAVGKKRQRVMLEGMI